MSDADATRSEHDARLQEVEGRQGFPGEYVDSFDNMPGSDRQPHQEETSDTAITDAKTPDE